MVFLNIGVLYFESNLSYLIRKCYVETWEVNAIKIVVVRIEVARSAHGCGVMDYDDGYVN